MAKDTDKSSLQDEVIDVLLRRGMIFPTAEIYGGIAGEYDFGPVGELIRQNIIDLWRATFIRSEENIYEIHGSTILPEKVFAASGHLSTFNDPLTQCIGKCKTMYRVDHLLQETLQESFEGLEIKELFAKIKENDIKCPKCGGILDEPKDFNLMFQTQIGPSGGQRGFLRPETAQNIFLNFRRISHSMRSKLPFGVAQIGRAYRNEISPRNFLVRLREFQQMEIEMFVDPDKLNEHPRWDEVSEFSINILTREAQETGTGYTEMTLQEAVDKEIIPNQYMAYFMGIEAAYMQNLGITDDKFWFRHLLDKETAHYSKSNYDLEIQFPFGIVESIGNAYRTDYDLMKHQTKSKQKMHIVSGDGKKVIPHVIEPSFGIERLFYAAMLSAYRNEGREWSWFQFPHTIAPWIVKVAPLMKKDGMKEYAYELFWQLKDEDVDVIFDESGQIGKRYARADEIGIPYVVTVDYDSLEDDTVTIRDRDTMEQCRIPAEEVASILNELVFNIISWENLKDEFSKGKESQAEAKSAEKKKQTPEKGSTKKSKAKKGKSAKKA